MNAVALSQTDTPTRLTPEQAAEILARHEDMVWWVANRVCLGEPKGVVEEVAAEVRAVFVRATKTFDPARGFKFATYALRCAFKRGHDTVRAEANRGIRAPVRLRIFNLGSATTPDGESVSDTITAREPDGRPEFPADFWERICGCLTARQAQMLLLVYRDGITQREAADRLQVSKQCVGNTLIDAYDRIRDQMPELEQYLEC